MRYIGIGYSTRIFFGITIAHNLGEVAKNRCPPDTSFSIQGGLFPPPFGTENVE
jgi:hypothetical protein